MDLVDVNGLTAQLKLRKLLKLAWSEVTGMLPMCWPFEIILTTNSETRRTKKTCFEQKQTLPCDISVHNIDRTQKCAMTWRGSHCLVGFIGDWNETPGENRHSLFSGLQRGCGFQYYRLLCFWVFIVKTFETLFCNVSFITFVSRSSIQMDRKFRPRIKSRRCWVRVRRHLLAHRKDDYR